MATRKTTNVQAAFVPPDEMKLQPLQAARLAAMSGVEAKSLTGITVAEAAVKFKFQIDPRLLLFRKVCGKVVKKDPVTGTLLPVPYASVVVEDTDCSLLGYFPVKSKWSWFFPFRCRREVIAKAKTDECGNFCVWIPRWDIDWILRFRRERFCFPLLFERPRLRDLLEEVVPGVLPQGGQRPLPEAGRGEILRRVEDALGRQAAQALHLASGEARVGASTAPWNDALDAAVLDRQLPPPLPRNLQPAPTAGSKSPASADAAMNTLAALTQMPAADIRGLDLRVHIGPFRRCFDILIPEWKPFIDIPDITFRVMQDTNGDGVEETIYSEGFFQVRWDAGAIGPLTLEAGPNALAGLPCGHQPIPCGDTPAIVLAGRMPVTNVPAIYDSANGYALRPNRPHPSGAMVDPLPNPPAAAPFHGAVALFGCVKTNAQATHYRVRYKYSADQGANFTAYTSFVGLTWPLFRLDGGGNPEWHYPVSDADGWYPIALPAGPNPFLPQDLILDWPTYAMANGRYVLKVELGTGGVVNSTSAEVAFNVDNSSPSGPMTIEWRKVGGGAFQLLTPPCPLVRRGAVPADLEFRVTLDASAMHLRSAQLFAGGCGAGDFVHVSGATEHWHVNAADNAETLQAIYRLNATAAEGTYSFSALVAGRAMNPSGGDGGHLILPDPWEYNPVNKYITPQFAFSVINAN
jgi:hypothetical protein